MASLVGCALAALLMSLPSPQGDDEPPVSSPPLVPWEEASPPPPEPASADQARNGKSSDSKAADLAPALVQVFGGGHRFLGDGVSLAPGGIPFFDSWAFGVGCVFQVPHRWGAFGLAWSHFLSRWQTATPSGGFEADVDADAVLVGVGAMSPEPASLRWHAVGYVGMLRSAAALGFQAQNATFLGERFSNGTSTQALWVATAVEFGVEYFFTPHFSLGVLTRGLISTGALNGSGDVTSGGLSAGFTVAWSR